MFREEGERILFFGANNIPRISTHFGAQVNMDTCVCYFSSIGARYLRRGLGKRMTDVVKEVAREHGAQYIELSASGSVSPQFFKAMGFTAVSESCGMPIMRYNLG